MEDKDNVCLAYGGSGILPGKVLCSCVQRELLKKIYGVFYPWAKYDSSYRDWETTPNQEKIGRAHV